MDTKIVKYVTGVGKVHCLSGTYDAEITVSEEVSKVVWEISEFFNRIFANIPMNKRHALVLTDTILEFVLNSKDLQNMFSSVKWRKAIGGGIMSSKRDSYWEKNGDRLSTQEYVPPTIENSTGLGTLIESIYSKEQKCILSDSINLTFKYSHTQSYHYFLAALKQYSRRAFVKYSVDETFILSDLEGYDMGGDKNPFYLFFADFHGLQPTAIDAPDFSKLPRPLLIFSLSDNCLYADEGYLEDILNGDVYANPLILRKESTVDKALLSETGFSLKVEYSEEKKVVSADPFKFLDIEG